MNNNNNNNTRIHQWCIVYRLGRYIYIELVGNFNEKQIGKEREREREQRKPLNAAAAWKLNRTLDIIFGTPPLISASSALPSSH